MLKLRRTDSVHALGRLASSGVAALDLVPDVRRLPISPAKRMAVDFCVTRTEFTSCVQSAPFPETCVPISVPISAERAVISAIFANLRVENTTT